MAKNNQIEECPAHKCKPFMILSYILALFLILGIASFIKYLLIL